MYEEFDDRDIWADYTGFTPKHFAERLIMKGGIVGQDAAVKAASLILYNHVRKRRSVNLFIGETGCGKSYIWNVLQKEMGAENILIYDANTLTAEGFKGSTKVSTIFSDIPPERRSRVILVLDEIDKLMEPNYISNGTNYSEQIQNQLLRLFNGDTLIFAGEDGFSVDSSGISIVLLGAFQKLRDRKKCAAAPVAEIGFMRQPPRVDRASDVSEITVEDFIGYGMRREIAGRITRIIRMNPLGIDELVSIGQREIKSLEQQLERKITVDYNLIFNFAYTALEKRLGARWIKSQLNNLVDNLLFDYPNAESFTIDFTNFDAGERSQAVFME